MDLDPDEQQPEPQQSGPPQQQALQNAPFLLIPTGLNLFHPGVLQPLRIRRRPPPPPARAPPTPVPTPEAGPIFFPCCWDDRIQSAPPPGHIRLLDPPPPSASFAFKRVWETDRTLTEWVRDLDRLEEHTSASFYPAGYSEELRTLFTATQRARWAARRAFNRWRTRIWAKRTVCNTDLIELQPVADRDAIFLTDVQNRQIYRFHRRDVFHSLLSNITLADEMLPTPRIPTNPWSNAPLTQAQVIALCQQLMVDYGRRAICPPVLFAAFCAAGYDIKRFQSDYSSLLSQCAITNYFKDLHEHNRDSVYDTMVQLIDEAGLHVIPSAVRRWLAETQITDLHREWLALVRDYTVYLNLHVQARPHWYSEDYIRRDVAALFNRTTFPDMTTTRTRLLRAVNPQELTAVTGLLDLFQTGAPAPIQFIQGSPIQILHDASNNVIGMDAALQLIQNALFRL